MKIRQPRQSKRPSTPHRTITDARELPGATGHRVHYYDMIRINSYQSVGILHNALPLDELKAESRSFEVLRAYKIARDYGFESRVEMVAPTPKCLKLLSPYEPVANCNSRSPRKTYRITKLEITRDTFYDSSQQAVEATETLGRTRRKKWSSKNQTLDRKVELEKENRTKTKQGQFLGRFSYYYGSRSFQFFAYTRTSKINGKPCLHEEWRISGSARIKQKTGISVIGDLIDFDLQAFFEENEEKFISHEEIDWERIGRWLRRWRRPPVTAALASRERLPADTPRRRFYAWPIHCGQSATGGNRISC